MNTGQIREILEKELGERLFLGVYACDQLPKKVWFRPACLVANTDPIAKGGEHWVAMWLDEEAEFFDSYGHNPSTFPQFTPFLQAYQPVNWSAAKKTRSW